MANGRKPLPIKFDRADLHTYQPVGENHTLFTRCIGNWIGFNVPKCYENWDKVPDNFKMAILTRLQFYFQLNRYRNGPVGHLLLPALSDYARIGIETEKARTRGTFSILVAMRM